MITILLLSYFYRLCLNKYLVSSYFFRTHHFPFSMLPKGYRKKLDDQNNQNHFNVKNRKLYDILPISSKKKADMDLLAFISPIHHNYFKKLVSESNDENEAGPLPVDFEDQAQYQDSSSASMQFFWSRTGSRH